LKILESFNFFILMVLIFFTISKLVSRSVIINKNNNFVDTNRIGNKVQELGYFPEIMSLRILWINILWLAR